MAVNNDNNSSLGIRLSSVMDTYSTRASVVKLGIDVLEQLITLRDNGAKCAVLTPTDIYVTSNGEFKLGTLPQRPPEKSDRFSHLVQLYTAPEAYDRIDGDGPAIFSLGTIMYKLLNGGLEPFRNGLDFDSASSAYRLRISGLRLSAPSNADALLSAIILKACEYNRDRRYIYAEDMLEELMLLADGNYQRKPRKIPEPVLVEEEVKENKFRFIALGVGIALVVLLITIVAGYLKYNDIYVRAERNLRDGKIEKAQEMFTGISWFKDSKTMILKCDFKTAEKLLVEGKTEEAVEIFKTLIDEGYTEANDALVDTLFDVVESLNDEGKTEEAMELISTIESLGGEVSGYLAEQRQDAAMELYIEGKYKEAREMFNSLGQDDMVFECDYYIALEYKKNYDYAEAMAAFNALDDYNDSKEQFDSCEEALIDENQGESVFAKFKNIEGRFSNEDGYYVEYISDDDKIVANYSLPFEDGERFRVEDGVHYHSTDGTKWKKQWIYEKISDSKLRAYNYIDGKIYELTRE